MEYVHSHDIAYNFCCEVANNQYDLSIDTGLTPGDMVVVDGTEKLREGSKVEVRNQKGAPAKSTDAPPAGTDKPKRGASS